MGDTGVEVRPRMTLECVSGILRVTPGTSVPTPEFDFHRDLFMFVVVGSEPESPTVSVRGV